MTSKDPHKRSSMCNKVKILNVLFSPRMAVLPTTVLIILEGAPVFQSHEQEKASEVEPPIL